MDFRVERDSIGTKEIVKDAYYGVQSLRGYENFRITGLNVDERFVKDLAIVKKACAIANMKAGELKEELGVEATIGQLHYIGTSYSDSFNIFHKQPFHNVQVSRVYVLWYDGEMTLQKEEIESVKWLSFEECQRVVFENLIPHCIKKEELEMIKKYLEEKE